MKRALLTLPAAAIAVLAFAGAASASTPGCTGGALHGYCGTQATDTTPALVMDSSGQRAAYGHPIVGWTDSTNDLATDFFQLAYAGDNTLGVMFMYAPGYEPRLERDHVRLLDFDQAITGTASRPFWLFWRTACGCTATGRMPPAGC
jgi:hypothetical protein